MEKAKQASPQGKNADQQKALSQEERTSLAQIAYRCYKKALTWIDKQRDLFNPLQYEREHTASSLYQTKALGELGLLCLLYQRCNEGMQEPAIDHFLHLMHTIWQQPEYQERIVRRPEFFQLHVMVYVVLQQCRVIDESYKATIQQVIDQDYVTATETTAMRLLDRRHLLDCGGFNHALPAYTELYQRTLLAQTPPAVYFTDTDVYAITHTLFYLTDFGRRAAPVLQDPHLLIVRWYIETLLGIYVRRQHWDLVGELLLDCYCLHWYPAIIFPLALEGLAAAQLADGAIAGPRFSAEHSAALLEPERRNYLFEQHYHTTVVNAITCFLLYQELRSDNDMHMQR